MSDAPPLAGRLLGHRASAGKLGVKSPCGSFTGPHTPEVDLGSLDFWGKSAEERDRYFARLRREAPISLHEPPEDILGLPQQGRMSYWAIVRYEDVRAISRDPQTFCSGEGTQFADAPPEFLEASIRSWRWTHPAHQAARPGVLRVHPAPGRRIEEGIRVNARQIVEEASPRPAVATSSSSSPSDCRW